MELLKTFFRKTHYFWIISRVILIILFLLVVVNQKFESKPSFGIVYGIIAVYVICMVYLSILEFTKKDAPKIIKIFTGGFSIFFGLVILYLLIFQFNGFVVLAFCVPIWLIIYGTWEIMHKVTAANSRLE